MTKLSPILQLLAFPALLLTVPPPAAVTASKNGVSNNAKLPVTNPVTVDALAEMLAHVGDAFNGSAAADNEEAKPGISDDGPSDEAKSTVIALMRTVEVLRTIEGSIF
jgi:hypothetical protein